ncbi:MAG: patatin-like phospholipase family protein [Bacteroidia bacterium]|nr:patatin-like phospholipase family protein [Bacteroidia bacterium]
MSGGGARGYAHIGVLQALNEKGIFPEVIGGTSAGSIAGAFYCDGKSPKEIAEILKKHDINGTMNLVNFFAGFMRHDKLKMVLDQFLIHKNFEELNIPLFINATNYLNGKEEIFSSGTIADKVIASSTLPILFEASKINGIPYVDGGLANNLLAQPLRPLCEIVIGVHVNPIKEWSEKISMLDNLDRALHMGINHNIEVGKKMCDLFIEPPGLSKFQILDSKKLDEIYTVGYEYTMEFLAKESF